MENHIQQPWDIQADRVQKKHGGALDTCRDLIILEWLVRSGDTRPFVDWVLRCNHQPGREVNRLLAIMMAPDPDPRLQIPFMLVKKKRDQGRRGRPVDLVAEERDGLLYEYIVCLMREGGKGTYESAIARVAEDGISHRVAKRAYNSRKKRQDK